MFPVGHIVLFSNNLCAKLNSFPTFYGFLYPSWLSITCFMDFLPSRIYEISLALYGFYTLTITDVAFYGSVYPSRINLLNFPLFCDYLPLSVLITTTIRLSRDSSRISSSHASYGWFRVVRFSPLSSEVGSRVAHFLPLSSKAVCRWVGCTLFL